MRTIQAVTIDFWNTLYDSSGGEGREKERSRVVLEQATRLGAELQPEALKLAQKRVWEHFTTVWKTEHRTPDTRSMVEYFWHTLNVHADATAIDAVTTVFIEGVLHHPPSLLAGAKEALCELHQQGIHLALISDTAFSPGRILKRVMERDGIAEYFTAFSFSDETGVSKPHTKAYHTALNGVLGVRCSAGECVHIGDIERTDVVGAKQLGMKAILFAGDPHNTMNRENKAHPTQADAQAASWGDALRIIRLW
jgi:putative hydrolase of the HAD superfamily